MNYLNPLRADIRQGHWAVLRNGWLVGPVLPPEFDCVFVSFDDKADVPLLIHGRDDNVAWDNPRRVCFSGTKEEAVAYLRQGILADELIDEILEEERQARESVR
jgi:hypothetical protein